MTPRAAWSWQSVTQESHCEAEQHAGWLRRRPQQASTERVALFLGNWQKGVAVWLFGGLIKRREGSCACVMCAGCTH